MGESGKVVAKVLILPSTQSSYLLFLLSLQSSLYSNFERGLFAGVVGYHNLRDPSASLPTVSKSILWHCSELIGYVAFKGTR